MRNTLILILLLAVCALIPWMVSRNNHTATVHGTFPEELTGVDYNWVYLRGEESVLDSCIVSQNRFTLATEVGSTELHATVEIPCCHLTQQITLRPRREIAIRVSLDEYYRQKAETAVVEALARLDENGLSLPDSTWNRLRDSLIAAYLAKQQ